mgnify:CR=1 FL=1|jgi:acyl-coenzyme A thioesterase PaaI-like protein
MSGATLTITIGLATATAVMLPSLIRRLKRRAAPPLWFSSLLSDTAMWQRLVVQEWDDPGWRTRNGWAGTDFVHGASAAVHVPDYVLEVNGAAAVHLVGAVHFGAAAESHRQLCHGGTMTAVMDDVIGWTGFCCDGTCRPWSGFTVQINTALKAPVAVGSWLRVDGRVIRREGGRKVWVSASLTCPETGKTHCEAEGLFLLAKPSA